MSRSVKKGPYVDHNVAKRVAALKLSGKKDPITTWARSSTILPDYVGLTFMVHNGKSHLRVLVTEDMVGHKLGEFSPTRRFGGHTNKKEEAKTDLTAAPE